MNRIISTTIFAMLFFGIFSCSSEDEIEGKFVETDTTIAIEAVDLYFAGDYQKSLENLDSVIRNHPEIAELYFWRAKNLAELGQYDDAIKEYTHAISLDSSYSKYYNNRGLIHRELGDLVKAQEDMLIALSLNSSMSEIFNNLGLVNSEMEKENYALAFYNMAIEMEPKSEYFINRGVSYLKLGMFQFAKDDFDNALKEKGLYAARSYLYRGIALYELNEIERACDDFTESLRFGEEDAREYVQHCDTIR